MTGDSAYSFNLAPRGSSKNRAFLVVWIALFVSITGIAMVTPLLPVFAEDMGASGIWLGLAFSGFALSQIPLMPIVGRLSDRFGKKFFLQFGLLVYVITAVAYIWAPGYQILVIFRIFSGIGTAMVIPTAFAYVGELSPLGHEGRYMALFNIAMVAGMGIGPLLGGGVHDQFGMDASFASMAALSALGTAIVWFFLPQVSPATVSFISEAEDKNPVSSSYMAMMKNTTMQGVLAFQMVYGLFVGVLLAFIGIWMTLVLETSVAQVGTVLAIRYILNGTLIYPFGWLADRLNRIALATTGLAMMAACTFSVPSLGSFGLLLGLFVITGTFESMAVPSVNAIAVEQGRSLGMGSVMAISNTAISVGLITGSLAGGVIDNAVGIVEVFQYTAVMGLAGIIIFDLLMVRNRKLKVHSSHT